MSAHKEEAKQRKRKSLKMALEKCMQRREAASTTTNTTTISSLTTTNTLTAMTSSDILMPEVSHNIQFNKELLSPLKPGKNDSLQEIEVLETTETETSMDTSAEVNVSSEMSESRGEEEEDLETQQFVNSHTAKDCRTEVKMTTDNYDDNKPLDFTKSPPKKLKVRENLMNHRQEEYNAEKDIEKYLKSTAVIKESSAPPPSNHEELNTKSEEKVNDSETNAVLVEKSVSLKEN